MRSAVLFIVLSLSLPLAAQMPQWRFFMDREGRTYYYDQKGSIRVPYLPQEPIPVVNDLSLDYYTGLMLRYLHEGKRVRALGIAKSLLALKQKHNRITEASAKAVRVIALLKKNNGSRYNLYDKEASIYFIKEKGMVIVIDDFARYRFSSKGYVLKIRERWRNTLHTWYKGSTFGIAGKKGSQTFKYLISIDVHKYRSDITDIDDLKNYREFLLGVNARKTEAITRSEDELLYSFASDDRTLVGYERFVKNGSLGYYIRVITTRELYPSVEREMKEMISKLHIVRDL
jgi:hypothetical protein